MVASMSLKLLLSGKNIYIPDRKRHLRRTLVTTNYSHLKVSAAHLITKSALLGLFLVGHIEAVAAESVWANPGTGDWNTSSNWNPNAVPGPESDVFIVNGGHAVISTGQQNVSRLVLSALNGDSGNLTVTGPGASVIAQHDITVSNFGGGTLAINNGGNAEAYSVSIGLQPNGQGTVVLDSGGTLTARGQLEIGGSGDGVLTLAGGSRVNFEAGGFNEIQLGSRAAASGTINIGAASGDAAVSAGFLTAAAIEAGLGTGLVNFNHTNEDYLFTTRLAGSLQVRQEGTGTTILTGNNTYTGDTLISRGTLRTGSLTALGSGTVHLDAGATLALNPGTSLQVSSLIVADGSRISLAPGTGSNIQAWNFTGNMTYFEIGSTGFQTNVEYDLLTYANLGSPMGTWEANTMAGLTPTFSLRTAPNGLTALVITYIGTAIYGNVIDNSGYPYTSTVADFPVVGNVTAAAGPQQVNSLTFTDQGTLFITDSLALNLGLVNVPNGTGTITGGVLVAPGDLTKAGEGLLDLDVTVVTGGNTNVSQGALAVNGTLVTDDVLVQQGATLKGSGSIVGDVVNNGTVAPGNSPGTLTVMGNFTQSSNGTLAIEVGDGASDLLLVTGTATLAGTLEAVEFGGHEFAFGDQVTFLQAGSIVGEFDQIVAPNDFRGRVLVNGGTGTLLLAPESYTQVAEGQNQTNVAKALDSFIGASGDRDEVSLALDLQTANQYGSAFDQIAPGFYQTLTDTVIEQTTAQNQMLAQRLSAVRLGTKGFNLIGLDQAALTVDRNGKNVMDAKDEKDIINPGTDTDWSVFVQGNGIFSRVTNVSQVPNYNYNSGGFIVGIDYTFGEKGTTSTIQDGKAVVTKATSQGSTLTVGLYTGYQGTFAKYANGGDMTINSALFGGYASYTNGGFYSDAIIGGAYNGYRVNRSINFSTVDRTARSTPDGGSFTTYLDAGYDWKVGEFTFGPVLSGQYTYAGTAGFTENGAESLDLSVGQQNANSIRTNVGGRVAFTWNVTKSITIIPEGRMFWQHEYLNGSRTIGASLNGGNGPGFDYETSAPGQDSVFAGAGVSANFCDRWNTGFYYNADFGRQDFVSHMISANLGWKF